MNFRRTIAAAMVAAAAAAVAVAPGTASAEGGAAESRSLMKVLEADGNQLDKTWGDFDITHRMIAVVLRDNPGSALGALSDGGITLTALLPTDRAWRRVLVEVAPRNAVSRAKNPTERAVYDALGAEVGNPFIEYILLSHVVPERKLNLAKLKTMDGETLTTASGSTVLLNKRNGRVFFEDTAAAPDAVIKRNTADINRGNPQIAHALKRIIYPSFS